MPSQFISHIITHLGTREITNGREEIAKPIGLYKLQDMIN